jgi:hypothetical protein
MQIPGTTDGRHTRGDATWNCLILMCACTLGMSGCFTRRTPAKPMIGHTVLQHPVMPMAVDAALEWAPGMPFEEVVAPPQLAAAHSVPPRPRVALARESAPAPADKAGEPTIAPELTAEESEAAKTETQRNLDMVEKNLAIAWGRKLNTGQQDLASKIRGFTDGAREAMRGSDWVRAKNLSKKAVVLSEQLAASL